MLMLYFPVMLLGGFQVPLWPVLVIFFAPYVSMMLQLALSRTREYDADLNAARLTGDPRGLAHALGKLEHYPLRILDLFMPGGKVPSPSILRSHPHTQKRIVRLLALAENDEKSGVR